MDNQLRKRLLELVEAWSKPELYSNEDERVTEAKQHCAYQLQELLGEATFHDGWTEDDYLDEIDSLNEEFKNRFMKRL